MQKSILAATLLAAVACYPALAQSPAREDAPPDMARMVKARGDDMALLIGLRPDQRAGLDAVLAAPPHPGGPWERRVDRDGPPSFQERIADMEAREGKGRQHLAAIKAFYQGLDAQQRAKFEAAMRLSHGPHGGPGGPPMGPPGMMKGPAGPGPRMPVRVQ